MSNSHTVNKNPVNCDRDPIIPRYLMKNTLAATIAVETSIAMAAGALLPACAALPVAPAPAQAQNNAATGKPAVSGIDQAGKTLTTVRT